MNFNGFTKQTLVNGFDALDSDNAKQNNYAWSMVQMDEYIYVGTARNIPYSIFSNQVLGDIPIPEILIPQNVDYRGEIWRFKADGSMPWERVYKAPAEPLSIGFRFMVLYTTPLGEKALYAGVLTLSPELIIIKSTDGLNWYPLVSGIQGYSTRAMVEHQGILFMGALPLTGLGKAQLFSSSDPESDGWQEIDLTGDPDKNPRGNIDLLLSFNDRLYVGTALPTGFEVWRTNGTLPVKDDWTLVVDAGAGDARNEHPWSWGVFKDYIYLGTAVEAAVLSLNPEQRIVPPKGFDLIRIDHNDNWELIVGGPPAVPTTPATGARELPLSGFLSGFGNISNAYCWQIQAQGNELYLGTFSWSIMIPVFLPLLPQILEKLIPADKQVYLEVLWAILESMLPSGSEPVDNESGSRLEKLAERILKLGKPLLGFDLWKTNDGVHWVPVTLNGLGNNYNYGVRKLFLSDNASLYLGTANPFEGCEVWQKRYRRPMWAEPWPPTSYPGQTPNSPSALDTLTAENPNLKTYLYIRRMLMAAYQQQQEILNGDLTIQEKLDVLRRLRITAV